MAAATERVALGRYGGPGVMIYWHVERKSVCVYSQLKKCSSSEVAAALPYTTAKTAVEGSTRAIAVDHG